MGLITAKEYAIKHGLDPATMRSRIFRGRIKTAQKLGRDWFLDEDEEMVDARIISGKYIDARKKTKNK